MSPKTKEEVETIIEKLHDIIARSAYAFARSKKYFFGRRYRNLQ
jgi:hypothetical protein